MRCPRFTLKRMMVGVAAAALLFAVIRLAIELRYWTFQNGWNTSLLETGRAVVIREDARSGETIVRRGTRCIVRDDPTDDDSAYPYRRVTVEIVEGPRKGAICHVERSLLRVR